tara:strand:- start:411 stop:695 length:285 start_codon:yes stop_codon:yes gene_type:complete
LPGFNNGNIRLPTEVAGISIHRNKAVVMTLSFRKIELSLSFTNTLDGRPTTANEYIQVVCELIDISKHIRNIVICREETAADFDNPDVFHANYA